MKTIEEAAMEYSTERVPDSYEFYTLELKGNEIKEEIYDSFRYGVEFAQRWIPVEKELPEDKQNILVKYKHIKLSGIYCKDERCVLISSFSPEKTEYISFSIVEGWRPIEIK